jgi:hypothetical protein
MNRRDTINATLSEEMKHIPRGLDPQNMLRAIYSSTRRASLGKNAAVTLSKEDVLQRAIAATRAIPGVGPDWSPDFDREFFRS